MFLTKLLKLKEYLLNASQTLSEIAQRTFLYVAVTLKTLNAPHALRRRPAQRHSVRISAAAEHKQLPGGY